VQSCRWALGVRRFVRAASVPLLVIVLCACDGGSKTSAAGGSAGPAGQASHSGSTAQTSITGAKAAQVTKDYDAYWVSFVAATSSERTSSRPITQHATGEALNRAQTVIAARHRAHELVDGTYRHASKVTALSAKSATVSDCLTAALKVVDARTMRSLVAPAAGPFPITTTLSLIGKTWMVSSIKDGSTDCSAPRMPHASPSPATHS
jgi:hypothetical protein